MQETLTIRCPLCQARMDYKNYHSTYIWSCSECPGVLFEYYNRDNLEQVANYLNNALDQASLMEIEINAWKNDEHGLIFLENRAFDKADGSLIEAFLDVCTVDGQSFNLGDLEPSNQGKDPLDDDYAEVTVDDVDWEHIEGFPTQFIPYGEELPFIKASDYVLKHQIDGHPVSKSAKLKFNYLVSFSTISELEDIMTEHMQRVTGKNIKAYINVDDEGTGTFFLTFAEAGEDEELSDETHELIAKKFINPQEEIELFRLVLKDIYGSSAFVENVDDDNIDIYVAK